MAVERSLKRTGVAVSSLLVRRQEAEEDGAGATCFLCEGGDRVICREAVGSGRWEAAGGKRQVGSWRIGRKDLIAYGKP